MSAHSQFRTPNRPVFKTQEFPNPDFEEGGDAPATLSLQVPAYHPTKRKLTPLPTGYDEDGNPTGWMSHWMPAQIHVLDFRGVLDSPSKNRRGRLPSLTANQRRLRVKWGSAGRRLRMQHAMDATALSRAMAADA